MAIPTRSEWQKIRDAAGGKAGMVKSISVGKALDAFHKAADKAGVADSIRPLNILEKDLKQYVKDVKPENAKLAKAVEDKVLGEVEKAQADVLSIAKYPGQITEGVAEIRKLMKKERWPEDLAKIAGTFRLIRAAAERLADVDPADCWAQIHRMTVLAHGDIEKLDKLYEPKTDPQTEKADKQMTQTEKTIEDALKAIERHNK